ncbi:DUF3137 domain-containing protein [Myxococcota bacterium]|nr:DUF3137 domain-containing protein [Myxococcota bacterium]
MKTQEEFDAFLRAEIEPRLRRVESERRAVQERRAAVAVSTAWKIGGALAGLALSILSRELFPFVLGAALPFMIEAGRQWKVPDTATPLIRSQILEPVITFWDPSFAYSPDGSIAQGEFEASRLFADESFNRYSGEDLVTGRHGETTFRFSELHVRRVQKTKKKTQSRTVFDGLFFVADFHKSFRGQTLVLPDTAERVLGSFGRSFQSLKSSASGLRLVELEDPAFERAFTVTSTDPTEARYLLSPSMMQRILTFHESTGEKLRLGFSGGCVHLALPLSSNLFSTSGPLSGLPELESIPGLRGLATLATPVTLDDVRRWGSELRFAISIIDDLDLNTRIWSKAAATG